MKNIIILLTSLLLLGSCKVEDQNTVDEKYIVTTTGMIGDIVQHIVSDDFKVEALMGPGTDPHLYSSSQSDLKKLTAASVIFYNGLHLEGKMAEDLHKLSERKKVFAVADGVEASLYRVTDGQGSVDPHIWFNVKIWIQASKYVYSKLCELYPHDVEAFDKNYEHYINALEQLDEWIITEMIKIPKKQRVLITAHDAFGYFGNAYDIEVIGLQGISTVSEASLKKRTDLVNLIVDRGIKSVFVESSVDPKYVQAIVEDCKTKGHEVTIGGTLYSDAMGEPSSKGGTYIGMVKSNVETIINALK